MKVSRKSIITVIECISDGAKKATKILDEKTKVTASKVHNNSILLTIGKLNYIEREYVKKCKKQNKSFKTILIKWNKLIKK